MKESSVLSDITGILKALIRIPVILCFILGMKLVPYIERLKQFFVVRYYRWKFPHIKQMRKLVGVEQAFFIDAINNIREPAKVILTGDQSSNSSKKRIKAKVYNAEKAFMEKHQIVIFYGQLYKLE